MTEHKKLNEQAGRLWGFEPHAEDFFDKNPTIPHESVRRTRTVYPDFCNDRNALVMLVRKIADSGKTNELNFVYWFLQFKNATESGQDNEMHAYTRALLCDPTIIVRAAIEAGNQK